MKKITMWDLFYTFLIIGSITIGGGPAGLSITQGYIVDKRKWITQEEMLDYITIGQSMPGVITVNIAILVGNKLRGKIGGILAPIGAVLPAFLSIIGIAIFLRPLLEASLVQKAFKGIRIGVLGLVINAAYRMAQVMKWNKSYIILGLISLCIFIFTQVSPVILFILGIGIGVFNYKRDNKLKGAEQ